MDTFLLLVTHCAQANLPLLELAVHRLVLGAGGGTQDLDSGYWADEFEGPMLLEALLFLVVCFCAFLTIGTPHGVLEVLVRTVGIDFALARCWCSVIPLLQLYFHLGNQSPSID